MENTKTCQLWKLHYLPIMESTKLANFVITKLATFGNNKFANFRYNQNKPKMETQSHK